MECKKGDAKFVIMFHDETYSNRSSNCRSLMLDKVTTAKILMALHRRKAKPMRKRPRVGKILTLCALSSGN